MLGVRDSGLPWWQASFVCTLSISHILYYTMSKFSELIKDSEQPVLVDFFATWCGPCQAMAPALTSFARKTEGKVKVLKVDIDKNPDAARHYQVRSVPTIVLFHKGNVLWRGSGAMSEQQMWDITERYTKVKRS